MARYMRSDLGRGHTNLRPPAVVIAADAGTFSGPKTQLAVLAQRGSPNRARRQTYSLPPYPVVIEPSIAWYGPGIKLTPTSLVENNIAQRGTYYVLRPPQVVTPAAVEQPVTTRLESQVRIRPPKTTYELQSPKVVHGAIEIFGPEQTLARNQPKPTTTRLTPPVVVHVAIEIFGPELVLVRTRPQPTTTQLKPPIVVHVAVEIHGPEVALARIALPLSLSKLQPPTIVSAFLVEPIQIALARIRPPVVRFDLAPALVVFAPSATGTVAVVLSQIKPQPTTTRLSPPVVITEEAEVHGELRVALAPRPKPRVRSTFVYPIVIRGVQALGYVAINLVRRPTPKTIVLLRRPSVVRVEEVTYPTQITLVRNRPGRARYFLRPPAILATNEPAKITLAPSRRGKAQSTLFPPNVVAEFFARKTQVTLVRITPPRAQARIIPPSVVAPVLFFGPSTEFAPSFRGKPKPFLRTPAVVNQPPAYQRVLPPVLTYSRRGRPVYFLNPPIVVFPFLARKIDITLAPQRRGKPKYFLRPPAILRTAGKLEITLTYSRRGKAKYFLRSPVVVRLAVEIFGPEVSLSRIKPRPTTTRLAPPTDVSDERDFGRLRVELTPSRRGVPNSFIKPPTVVGQLVFFGPRVELAPSSFGEPKSLLKKPTVIGEPERYFGPLVHIARIKPPKVISFTIPIEVPPFRPDEGDVCGFDISTTFICFTEETTESAHRITGGERSSGSVIGGDQEAN